MMLLQVIVSAAALIAQAAAQSSTLPAVPTGTPVPGNYTGAFRPQVHYSPPQNFMNDPNGCFRDANGTWHLYYQYDATGDVAGNQHWGHATSPDLYHWTNQQIALFAINESSYIFSGSAVVDSNNTSGFFPDQDNGVVAIFTIATYAPVSLESQGIAYSHDGGYTFEMYADNPVLDIGSSQFRDPQVFWYEDHWVMAVAYAQDFVVGIFTSPDLKAWTHASNFTRHGLLGLQYECPNLVEVPVEDAPGETVWLLQISINPSSPQGGSSQQYFLGAFDGYQFTPADNTTRVTDFAKDAYAGQFFGNLPRGEAVSITWASNWQYAQAVPTGELEGWRSAMSLPRRVAVRTLPRLGRVATAQPYDLAPVLGAQLAARDTTNASHSVDFSTTPSNAIYLNVSLTNLPAAAAISSGTVNFTLLSPITGEFLRAGFYLAGDSYFFVDRGGASRAFDNVFFTDKFAAVSPLPAAPGGAWSMQAAYDRSLFETFLDGGALASTSAVYASSPLTLLSVAADALPPGARARVEVYALDSVWAPQEDALGTVRGNASAAARAHPRVLYEYEAGFAGSP